MHQTASTIFASVNTCFRQINFLGAYANADDIKRNNIRSVIIQYTNKIHCSKLGCSEITSLLLKVYNNTCSRMVGLTTSSQIFILKNSRNVLMKCCRDMKFA